MPGERVRLPAVTSLLILAAATLCAQSSPGDRVLGTWVTASTGPKVEIVRCGDAYCGSIKSLRKPVNDVRNPDPGLRGRPLLGLQILTDVKYTGSGVWTGGTLYGPERGVEATPRLVLLSPDSLEIRVTRGIAHKTVIWAREK
jgi:uncharacterized protein (DUF2147 family)